VRCLADPHSSYRHPHHCPQLQGRWSHVLQMYVRTLIVLERKYTQYIKGGDTHIYYLPTMPAQQNQLTLQARC
jgi:hypothetical protein